MKTTKLRTRIAVVVAGLVLFPMAAWAGQGLLTLPNQNLILRGTYAVTESPDGNIADCFQTQVYTAGGECVRIQVLQQDTDLEMVLVGPDGTVWRNDDGGGNLRPLIKARTPQGRGGWATVQLCHFAGGGAFGLANFRLKYGRFSLNSNQCANATAPLESPSANRTSEEGKEGEDH